MLPGMTGHISGVVKPPLDIVVFPSSQFSSNAASYTRTGANHVVPANDYNSILLVFTTVLNGGTGGVTGVTWNSQTATQLFQDTPAVSTTAHGGCFYFVVAPHATDITSNMVFTMFTTSGCLGICAYLIENVNFTTPRDFRDYNSTPFSDFVNVPAGSAVLAWIADFFPTISGSDGHTWTGVNEDVDIAVKLLTAATYHSSGSIKLGAANSSYDVSVVCGRVPTEFVMSIVGWR